MGKTPKPLKLVVLEPLTTWPEIEKLELQGHTIIRVISAKDGAINLVRSSDLLDADVILGLNCWRMDNDHRKYLALAIKEARMIRYPNAQERASTRTRDEVQEQIGLVVEDDVTGTDIDVGLLSDSET